MSHFPLDSTDREFLLNAGSGFGAIALTAMLESLAGSGLQIFNFAPDVEADF
jgi:hypothetical protein